MDYLIVVVLIILSALFSGLTLGFFSLNRDDLKRKAKIGDQRAKAVYELRRNGNQLLSTLLIGNVAVNATISILLGTIAPGVLAGFIATFLIVIFGEIMPQAMFARYAMVLSAKLIWLVKFFRFILYPVTWLLAAALNKILGDEVPTVYTKSELIKIIEEHEDMQQSDLDADEERILRGALSFSEKKVADIMTPRTAMYSLQYNDIMNAELIARIKETGHSRIPIYQANTDEITGILYAKDLIANGWENRKVGEIARQNITFVDDSKKLDDLLAAFKKTRQHLFLVLNRYGGVSGLVTIEDVIEEIIGEEIVDEFDQYEDLQEVARNKMREKKFNKV